MKTDREMAHEFAMMQLSKPQSLLSGRSVDGVIRDAWEYIDTMNAEADKREKEKEIKEVENYKEFMNTLSGQISCWSCGALVKLIDRSQNDGCCPNCNVEIEL